MAAPDEKLLKLHAQLMAAVDKAIDDSDEIAGIVREMQAYGVVSLVFNVGAEIGVARKHATARQQAKAIITDAEFLRLMGISTRPDDRKAKDSR